MRLAIAVSLLFSLCAGSAFAAGTDELRPAPVTNQPTTAATPTSGSGGKSGADAVRAEEKKEPKIKKNIAKILWPDQWKTDLAEAGRFMELKQYDRAEELAQTALNQIKKQPHSTDEFIHCQLLLADAIYKQDRFDEAVPLYRKALKIAERSYGKASKKLLPILMTIGEVYEVDGNFRKSVFYYTQAINACDKNDGMNSLSSVLPRQHLAHVHALEIEGWANPPRKTPLGPQQESLSKEAEGLYNDCLSILLKQERLDSADTLELVLSDYTDLELHSVLPRKALVSSFQNELLKDKVAALRQKRGTAASRFSAAVSAKLGENSLDEANIDTISTAASGRISAPIQLDRKYADFAALEEINKQRVTFYERLIAADIDSLGKDHPSVARDLSGLASIYLSSKNYEQAKPLLKRALEIYQKVYKDDSAPVRQTALLLDLLNETSSKGTINIDLSFLQNLPQIPLQAQTIEVALRLNDLAFMLYCQGRIDSALTVYNWALASTVKATGDNSLLTASSMLDMSRLLRLSGKTSEAELYENNARAIARQDLLEKRSQLLP